MTIQTSHSSRPGEETEDVKKQRVIEEIKVTPEMRRSVLNALKLEEKVGGDVIKTKGSSPDSGRIASNTIVQTEKGRVMVRFYPESMPDKLETGFVEFEVAALRFLASKGSRVPAPLSFTSGDYLKKEGVYKTFAYKLLPGKQVSMDSITEAQVGKIGTFLANMLETSSAFDKASVKGTPPTGDIPYISDILERRLSQDVYSGLSGHEEIKLMKEFLKKESLSKTLKRTPQGVVHADFFDENVLVNEQGVFSLIDFGDAYYGAVVQDAAIGCMEFSIRGEKWNLDFARTFLDPLKPWLSKNKISGGEFVDLIMLNCVRFMVYTLPFTLEEGNILEKNNYLKRFKTLRTDSELRTQITKLIDES